jgi:hypothetical protein
MGLTKLHLRLNLYLYGTKLHKSYVKLKVEISKNRQIKTYP